MPIRRHCDPLNVQAIWNAIRYATEAGETVDATIISKHLQTTGCSLVQSDLFIKQCLKDKLIIPNKKNGAIQTYRITNQENPESDGKDWYCFECHTAGDVTCCSNCFRVFHNKCLSSARQRFELQKNTISSQTDQNTSKNNSDSSICILSDDDEDPNNDKRKSSNDDIEEADTNGNVQSTSKKSSLAVQIDDTQFDEALCSACNISMINNNCNMQKDEMNYILRFVLNRVRSWLPENIMHKMAVEENPEWLSEKELNWRANQLFFEHIDMSTINVKLNTETYTNFAEFLVDVYTIQHNVAIFHGTESQEYGAAELVVQDTIHDLTEMKNCVDCYRYSNEKINSKWFCLPCRKPHAVVWAKQKGYPYWPAKVLKETFTHFDVRFFGGKYERAFLERKLVKPITTPKQSLQVKQTASFNKACEEMKYYQTLVETPSEVEKLKASAKPSRSRSLPKQRSNNTTMNSSNSCYIDDRATLNGGDTNTNKANKRKFTNCKSLESNSKEKKKKNANETEKSGGGETSDISGNVIDISDGDDEEHHEYSFRQNNSQEVIGHDDSYEQVSSSTGQGSPKRETGMQPLDQPYSDSVEKMRRKLESLVNKNDMIKCAMDSMQAEIDLMTNDHNEHLKRLFESHNQQISETKKKQWCYNCEQDAIYHCCWNTAYCSTTCQQQHWQTEHKKVCRRKR